MVVGVRVASSAGIWDGDCARLKGSNKDFSSFANLADQCGLAKFSNKLKCVQSFLNG